MRDGELKIYYKGKDRQLEDALIEHLRQFGYGLWASGYDLVDDIRDLAFEQEPAQTKEE